MDFSRLQCTKFDWPVFWQAFGFEGKSVKEAYEMNVHKVTAASKLGKLVFNEITVIKRYSGRRVS